MTIIRGGPVWFKVVAVVLLLWGLMGCYACLQQLRLGAEAMGPATAYDRALYSSLPGWYNVLYVAAVVSGTAGAAALMARSRVAIPLAIVASLCVVVLFGYMFLATDLIAHKGAAAVVPFPLFVAAIAAAQLWLSRLAAARGWIG